MSSKAQLLEMIDTLEKENDDLNDRLDQIADICACDEQEEHEPNQSSLAESKPLSAPSGNPRSAPREIRTRKNEKGESQAKCPFCYYVASFMNCFLCEPDARFCIHFAGGDHEYFVFTDQILKPKLVSGGARQHAVGKYELKELRQSRTNKGNKQFVQRWIQES
jgi:hypothetical protein